MTHIRELKIGLRGIEVFLHILQMGRLSLRFGRSSTPRIDQSRYVATKLLVADARIISGIVRLYLLHRGRLAAASRFKWWKDEETGTSVILCDDLYEETTHCQYEASHIVISQNAIIREYSPCILCRGIMDFVEVDTWWRKMHSNLNLSEFLVRKTHISYK